MGKAEKQEETRLHAIINSLTAGRVADAERIEQLEAKLRHAEGEREISDNLNDARLSRLQNSERHCKSLQHDLDAATESLHRTQSSGHELAAELATLLRELEARVVPPLAVAAASHSSGEGAAAAAQAIAQANLEAAVSGYKEATARMESMRAKTRSLTVPLRAFQRALLGASSNGSGIGIDAQHLVFASAEEEAEYYVQAMRGEVRERIQAEEKERDTEKFQNMRESNRRMGEELRRRKAAQQE